MWQWNSNPSPQALGRKWRSAPVTALAAVFFSVPLLAQRASVQKPFVPPTGVEIVSNAGEPELRVDGVPFFLHSAQFDYFRIPPDLWSRSLDRYRDLGINTIDLRIPWNWHEPRDAEFDFDGHTNPRRNLRGLLQLITEKHLKLVARPGPLIGDQWRNAGYPAWLLVYSDYKMATPAIDAGLSPPDADLAAQDANAAARDWLANETHMTYARRWLTSVARELAPYTSKKVLHIAETGEPEKGTPAEGINGPLLFVVLDDAVAIRAGSDAPELSRYLGELRRALARGGLDAISFLNVPDIAAQGATPLLAGSATDDQRRVGLAGQWMFKPSAEQTAPRRLAVSSSAPQEGALLTTADAFSLSFLARSIGAQPDFPPLVSGFATTTFTPTDDIRAPQASPENMLLASRLLLGSGVRGITYSPLQDTLTPAGWGRPVAARYFRWDAALDLAGNRHPGAFGVMRNGLLTSAWGAMLASSHPRADFGIVDVRTCLAGASADESAVSHIAQTIEQVSRVAGLAGFTPELLDPGTQPVERLLRDAVILLPSSSGSGSNFILSEMAQATLVEFVRRGGVLVYFPSRPQGTLFAPLWQAAPAAPIQGENIMEWPFERGRVVASSNDFYTRVSFAENLKENQTQTESSPAIESLTALLARAGAPRNLRRAGSSALNPEVILTQLVSNEVSSSSAPPKSCAEDQLCAAALVSVTNLSSDQPAAESFEIIDPRPNVAGAALAAIPFNVTVPARESLLLPVHAPLCSAVIAGEHCTDEVVSAGAELLGVGRDGKTLLLTFYAPARATARLQLESQPTKVEFETDYRLETQWKQDTGELEFALPRGAAPGFRRVIRIQLRYTPHVKAKPDPSKIFRDDSEYDVLDAIRLPLAQDASIPSGPPLVLAGPGAGGQMTITGRTHTDSSRLLDFVLDGAFHGAGWARVYPDEQSFTRLRFQPTRGPGGADPPAPPAPDGLLHAQLTMRSGHEHASVPVLFVPPTEAGNTHYQYDFDRDGAPEWVLESNRLRVIVSPEDGGRALALVDKSANDDLITLGGALHDLWMPAVSPGKAPVPIDFAFNRAFQAAWAEEIQGTGLRLSYSEHEHSTAGLHVEKILRLTAPETAEATYRVSLGATAPSASEVNLESTQSFLSTLSVPASASEEGTTRFCWQPPVTSTSGAAPAASAKSAPELHCEEFVPSGAPVLIPAEITRLEIDSAAHQPFMVEWTSVRVRIIPGKYSAQIEFGLPLLPPGAAPAEFTLRYTVGESKP
jgi:hypothetical protein